MEVTVKVLRRPLQEQQMSGAQQLQSGAALWAAAAPLAGASLSKPSFSNEKNSSVYSYLSSESFSHGGMERGS